MVEIQGNVNIKTIAWIKHLGSNVKRLKVLLCFDYQNVIIDVEED
jgi:hypothetical protein